jgi:hypothetical protein
MHIADTAGLFERAAAALANGGHIAFEEACLVSPPRGVADRRALEQLERLWAGRFLSHEAWQSALAHAGFGACAAEDVTGAFVDHFERLASIARTTGVADYPAHETDAFAHAIELARAGLIGYSRFVARR